MKFVITFIFIISCCTSNSQTVDSTVIPKKDTVYQTGGVPKGFAIVFTEMMFTGLSFYAAQPSSHGPIVVGGLYAASSLAAFVGANLIWFTTKDKKNPKNKSYALLNSAALLGMSYGFYRIANYNLRKAEGHSPTFRFFRNFLELHAAYIVPLYLAHFVEKQYDLKMKKKGFDMSMMISPGKAGMVVKF